MKKVNNERVKEGIDYIRKTISTERKLYDSAKNLPRKEKKNRMHRIFENLRILVNEVNDKKQSVTSKR